MKKILLTLGLLITVSNLTIGIVYSAKCQTTGGTRVCGQYCQATAGGGCECDGACTAEETKWVEGAGGGGGIEPVGDPEN